MANGMGSLYIGASGLQNSQNALNTTANNLANVDTKGYVRQQVLFEERNYNTIEKSFHYSYQQVGLGVTIGDVAHTRDIFLDRYYRDAAGRQAFYQASYASVMEVEDLFQELEGETYQSSLEEFWSAFEEMAKMPDDPIRQSLLVQKSTLFAERAQSIYNSLKSYQKSMNVQINDTVEQINKLGKKINELNKKIMAIEAGGKETAMTLRDQRDSAIDELSTLAKIETKEMPEGIMKVKIEGVIFVDEVRVNEMGLRKDKETEFLTPYWPHLSDEDKGQYYEVFNFENGVSTANKTDVGKLKAMILARGDHFANHNDLEGINGQQYNVGVGQSVVMNIEAQFDKMVHSLVNAVNDLLCPNTKVTFVGEDGKVYKDVLVWDEKNAAVGSDGVKPGHELFVRRGCERYTEVKDENGKSYYVYNEEDSNDTSKQYMITSLTINKTLLQEEAHLPHILSNGQTDWGMAQKLEGLWTSDLLRLTPDDPDACTFKEYYQRMLDGLADTGAMYNTLSESLNGSIDSIENQRQQVIGVSSDEELTNMIKYQNAYNAASRYINVISEMLEHIIMQLGA